MQIITTTIEARMLELVKEIRGETGFYALHFHLALLHEDYKNEFQLRIAANILNDIFREEQGMIFVSRDADIFVIYNGEDRQLLEKAIFQLRYLFVDDPIATSPDGSENPDFCTMYDLAFQWRPFHRLCTERMELAAEREEATRRKPRRQQRSDQLTPSNLLDITAELEELDIGYAMRKQPICAIRQDKKVKPVFHEIYINMAHLRKLLIAECNLLSDKWLFRHLTDILDYKVIELLMARHKHYLDGPISLNLNVRSLMSERFMELYELISSKAKVSLVAELDVADVFSDMNAFKVARKQAQRKGIRLCLDGLNNDSFVQLDREKLGFDLIKLQWNADMPDDLASEANQRLRQAIKHCGSNRMILCRCDSQHAIEYGHALGITLFQGRYPDRVLDPDAVVIN